QSWLRRGPPAPTQHPSRFPNVAATTPTARAMWSPTAWSRSDEATLPMRVELVRPPPAPASAGALGGSLPVKVELSFRPSASGCDVGDGGSVDGALPRKVQPSVASCAASGSASDTPDVDTDEDAVWGSWSSADDSSPEFPPGLLPLCRSLEATPAARTRLRSQAAMYLPGASPILGELLFWGCQIGWAYERPFAGVASVAGLLGLPPITECDATAAACAPGFGPPASSRTPRTKVTFACA
ncbi:unnamed protein product, partial [Prorocentrum cordatum]